MSKKVNPCTLLKEVVEPVLQKVADEINSTRGAEGFVARTGSCRPYVNPERPVLAARSITIYRDEHHETTVSVFCISDSDELFVQDIRILMGASRIKLDMANEENIESAVKEKLKI